MMYEMLRYTVNQGKMEALKSRFGNITMKYFERHGIRPVGFFTNAVGGPSNEFTYLLQWDDMAHRERAWTAFSTDPEWIADRVATELDGALVHHYENRFLTPTEYSPLH